MRRLLRLYTDALSGLPRDVWLLTAAVVVNRAGTMVVPFLALWLTRARGYGADEAGLFLVAFGVGSIAGSWLGGHIADRFGGIRAQVISLLASSVGFVALGQATGTVPIAASIFAVSVVSESFRPGHMSAIAALVEPGVRARALGLSRLGINAGMSIGPAVGGFLAEVDYRYLFWADGASCLVAGLGIAWMFRGRAGADLDARRASAGDDSNRTSPARSPLADRRFLAVCVLWVFAGFAFFQNFTTLPLYMADYLHIDEGGIGLFFTLNTGVIIAVEMPLLRAVEGRNPVRARALGVALLCGGNALLLLISDIPVPVHAWLALTVLVWTAGEMLAFPLMSAWVANRASNNNRGRYMGAFAVSFGVASTLGPVVGLYIYSHAGPDTVWAISGVIGAVLGIAFTQRRLFGDGD